MARQYRNSPSQPISFSITRPDLEKLNAFCERYDLNRSKVVRDALSAYVEAYGLAELAVAS